MVCTAKVIADSINPAGMRLTTLQLTYWRGIHSEFMTHRVFSRNASSSRAIPVAKVLEQVRKDPAMPCHWGKNQPGMQAREEHRAPVRLYDEPQQTFWNATPEEAWREAALNAAVTAEAMAEAGYHKQVVNRLLEPFQFIHVVVSATEWDNFFNLRDHEDADPNIQALARTMCNEMARSAPVRRTWDQIAGEPETANCWHLPYVTEEERWAHFRDPVTLAMLSTARCARVSYLTHDGKTPNFEADMKLYERLVGSTPIHASPTEHAACVMPHGKYTDWCKNFQGWTQHRHHVEMALQQTSLQET